MSRKTKKTNNNNGSLCVCLTVGTPECRHSQWSEEVARPPEVGVTAGCELPYIGVSFGLLPLYKQLTLVSY